MSSPTPPQKKRKELPTELRMLLAFVLMGIILIATPLVYRKLGFVAPVQPAKKIAPPAVTKTGPENAITAVPPASEPEPRKASGANSSSGAASAAKEQEYVVDTQLYHVVFSNRGAVVKSWTLKKFKDRAGKPLELVNEPGAKKVGYPFGLEFRDKQPPAKLNTDALWVPHSGADGLSIEYQFSDRRTTATKSFNFQSDGYMVQVADDVKLDGNGLPNLFLWRGGFGDMAVQNAPGQQNTLHYDPEKGKAVRESAKSAKNGPVNFDGPFLFAGIEDQYFTATFLPSSNGPIQTTTFDDAVPTPFNSSEEAFPGVAVGGDARNQLALYVGPKELSALNKVNPKLDGIVDWGWFGFIAKPLFIVLHWMNDRFVHNYGWSIILVTIVINFILFPLKLTNLKSMRKMQSLQPEMNRINEKYKGISMSDPRASQKQQEMMDLYKKHGVNPMGGCLPLLIQLPFLWAFYKVLTVSIEMRNASWLWVADLSQPEHLAIRILPILLIATGFLLQRMTPMTGGDPNQQKMMQFMPLMWGVFFWSASSGLVLYWLTGNLVGIAQQWFFNKTAASVPAVVPTKKIIAKDGRKRA